MRYTIQIKDNYIPPSYTSLFDFIESDAGQATLEMISSGHINFSVIMTKLKNSQALPKDSSKRVWHSLYMLSTNRLPKSVLQYTL